MKNNLIIIDDDLPFRDRLARSMKKKGFVVESYADIKSTFKARLSTFEEQLKHI